MKRDNRYKKLIKKIRELAKSKRIPFSFSRKKNNIFSNVIHITSWVLMQKEKKHYRDMPDFLELLRDEIGLRRIPHFTTINKFALRVKPFWFEQLISEIVKSVSTDEALICAIDGTGFSLVGRSAYYETVAGIMKEFIQFNSCCESSKHLITACKIRRKKRHETIDAPLLMKKTSEQLIVDTYLGDKAYDSEKNHEIAESLGSGFIAPLREKTKQYHRISGYRRKRLYKNFPREIYNRRASLIENMHSIIKGKYGEIIYAKKFKTQKNELLGKVIAYDLEKIIIREGYFLQH
jgi:hypothetical protein